MESTPVCYLVQYEFKNSFLDTKMSKTHVCKDLTGFHPGDGRKYHRARNANDGYDRTGPEFMRVWCLQDGNPFPKPFIVFWVQGWWYTKPQIAKFDPELAKSISIH